MKTLVVANQKGGVGKTTTARHLAFYGAEKGLRVLAVDMDVQGNFTTTFQNIAEKNGFKVDVNGLHASGIFEPSNSNNPVQCAKNLFYIGADPGIVEVERRDLEQVISEGQKRFRILGESFDVCVVDTGPAVSNLLVAALSIGDYAISPCKPDRDAIAGLAGYFSNVIRVRDNSNINPKLAALGVLPNQINKKRAYHKSVLAEMREHWGDSVLPVELYERAAIDVAKDRAVWLTDKGESHSLAAREMKAVCKYIYQQMGI